MITVEKITRETRAALRFSMGDTTPDREGWSAIVRTDDDYSLHLSRLDGETEWVADAMFGPGSYPHWSGMVDANRLVT